MKSRQQYDISLRPYSAQRPPHLELSSLDRMHTGTMFPAAMQLIITDPITAIVVYGGWADQMHTNSDADPREIPQDMRQQNPPAGTRSYLCGRANLPSAAAREMRSCTRRSRPMRRQRQPWHHPLVYVFSPLVKLRVTKPITWPARINLPLLGCGPRWLEAAEKLPRFHTRALPLDVSRHHTTEHPASELPPTGCLPVQCEVVGISENSMANVPYHDNSPCGISDSPPAASKNPERMPNTFS
jgi:hypothetical protein